MSSEETPLLAAQTDEHEAVYNRFSPKQKRAIVALVSYAGLIPFFVSGSFIPSIPNIARELNSTSSVISMAVSLFILSIAVGSLTLAAYSNFYGRRVVYLCGLPILVIGSLGVTFSKNVTQLMTWRFLQAFGSSGGVSVGAAVIGDIYKLEERGTAMGVFFASILVGPTLSPLMGGLAAYYASWRVMQLALAISGLFCFILMAFFLPETSHPHSLGIDKSTEAEDRSAPRPWKWVWLNPFASLWLLRSPNIMAISIAGGTVLFVDYVLIVPVAQTIGARYGITNEALIGACLLPCGLGNCIGAPVAGRLSDGIVLQWRKKRGGVWVPEDRLRATLAGALILVPLSAVGSGFAVRYVDGVPGIVLNLLFLFMNGFGVDLVLSPSAAYTVDIMHSRSAEVMAVNSAFRSAFIAAGVTGILPSIDLLGVLPTDILAGVVAWIGFGLLWATIKYGDRMRAWVDVGYSTIHDN